MASFFDLFSFFSFFLFYCLGLVGNNSVCEAANLNYGRALNMSLLFFQGQRSGKLPHGGQQVSWRGNSALHDGALAHVDLTGGYYDAGDNVKFNFPMAFTTTMLSWSVIEYGKRLGGSLPEAKAAIRWATDYLLKCATTTKGKLYVGVGDPNVDHQCWQRPEDMTTVRSVYSVSSSNPGSDVAGETAAALAAASLVFRRSDPRYSKTLLSTARSVFQFAVQYPGSYSDSLRPSVCPFYCSYSGFHDELMWGAAWMLRATNDVTYFNYLKSLGGGDSPDMFSWDMFSWDNKYAGANVLLSRKAVLANNAGFMQYKQQAESFMCKILPNNPSTTTKYTPGGLMYKLPESNLQYVTSISFLLTTYSKYMSVRKVSFNCGNVVITPAHLKQLAKQQVDYILGKNRLSMSYMVGYGPHFPERIHHRGSSIPSEMAHPPGIGCNEGFQYFNTENPNPNLLIGAIVGGPDQSDDFPDQRGDYSHSEPATYINAAIVGPLAYFARTK